MFNVRQFECNNFFFYEITTAFGAAHIIELNLNSAQLALSLAQLSPSLCILCPSVKAKQPDIYCI